MRIRHAGWLVALAIVIFFAIGGLQIPHVEATGGLALDGSGFGSRTGINSCVLSQNLTTTQQPDVIVALVAINDTTTTVTSPTDTASLHWTYRASRQGLADVQIFFYYAIASQVLAADNITFGLSSSRVATICETFGISGADTNLPFDPNPGMPNTNYGNYTTNSVTYNTYNPNDFLIILQGFCASGSAGSGGPSGFTPIVGADRTHVSSNNCPDFFQTNTYYEIVPTTQSSNTVSWPFDAEYSPFAIIGDAIQSTPGSLSASVVAGSNAVDLGQLESFSCTGMGGVYPYAYSWTFGDGSIGAGASTTHIYSATGSMSVTCTVTDSLGTTANGAAQLTVNTRKTLTSVTCAGPFITNHGSACNVTVTDNSPGTFITPGGTLSLSQTGVTGSFTACVLGGTSASATCSSTFTASVIGTAMLTASYPGDSTHASSSGTTSIGVNSPLSITSFTASLSSLDPGERVTLAVSTSGGGGALSYSYVNLPTGCLSTNATTLSCTPSSSGNYAVRVTVTDQAGESVAATVSITVGPQKVLGLPAALGLGIIFGTILGIGALAILSTVLVIRRRKRRQAP